MIVFFGFKAIAYAADPEKLKAYYATYDQCLEKLGLSQCDYYIYIYIYIHMIFRL